MEQSSVAWLACSNSQTFQPSTLQFNNWRHSVPINTVPLEQFAAENGLAPTTCKLGEEFGKNGENARYPVIDWLSNSPNSPNSSGGYTQAAVFPEDSILKP